MAIFKTWMMRTETGEDGTTLVTASTPTPDRMGDVVSQDWDITRYEGNPIIAWAHDYTLPPVGKAVGLALEGDTLVARIKWDDSEANPLGQTVAHQYREGFLSAVSVGFAPGKTTARAELPEDHPAAGHEGYYFEAPELLEISAVPIPANAEALAIRAKQWGLSLEADPETTVEPAEAAPVDFWGTGEGAHTLDATGAATDALEAVVRTTLLELLGYDSQVQDAVDSALTDTDDGQKARNGWADLFHTD
jgi:HK97 family phage prohead protease